MADVFDKKKRSDVMSRVKSKNTRPEILVRHFLHSQGFRYSLHDKTLPGKPDIKLTKYKTVIFENGCFWHGHSNKCGYLMPKTNAEFWDSKIKNNVERDKLHLKKLHDDRWNVITVWECELKRSRLDATLQKLVEKIKNGG